MTLKKGPLGRLLLSAFLGELVVDRDHGPIPAGVLLEVLGELGLGTSAARSVIARSVDQGLLTRIPAGREVDYTLPPPAVMLLRRNGARVRSRQPFARGTSGWTLLSFTVPEGRRDARHRLRARLDLAGFRPLRDGVWISPGRRNVRSVVPEFETPGTVEAFHAQTDELTDIRSLIERVWDLPRLRAAHDEFLQAWESASPGPAEALGALVGLVAQWLELLLLDPGLPADAIGPDWPSPRSAATAARLRAQLAAPAAAAFSDLLATHLGQRPPRP